MLELALSRLRAGAVEYGDESFGRSSGELVGEIREELADVVVWAGVLAARIPKGEPARMMLERIAQTSAHTWEMLDANAVAFGLDEYGPGGDVADAEAFIEGVL